MMPPYRWMFVPMLAGLIGLIACTGREDPPPVPYAKEEERYGEKIDFARLEHELPLTQTDLMKITPDNLKGATQEQVDQIYVRLTAGPIPDGIYDGQMFFPKGAGNRSRLAEIAGGGIKGLVVNWKEAKVERLAEFVWKGKVFDRGQRVLRNRIQDLAVLKLVLGPDSQNVKKIDVDGSDAWLLFPAKLYCGQSLVDGRRESIIIDYAFTDDLPGYREMPDIFASREGLEIRDEIRMVRPGFYLGRAYMKKAFVLNFTLYNKDVVENEGAAFVSSGMVNEDCWIGPQRVATMKK